MHFGDIEVRYPDGGGLRLDGGGPSKVPSKIGASRATKKLVFVADLLRTRHHIPLPKIMAYDLYPLQTLETKRRTTRSKSSRWT